MIEHEPGSSRSAGDLVERFHEARRSASLVILEGFHPLKHALRFEAEIIEAVTADPERVGDLARALAPDLIGRFEAVLRTVPPEHFERLVPTPPPTGVVAIARRPATGIADVLGQPGEAPVVLLENPSRLGNLGAAIRAAAAAGAAGALAIGRHDPWHPEAIRGGAGLQFALPVARIDALPIEGFPGGRPLVAVHPAGEPLRPERIPSGALLAFGSERHGLSPDLLEKADRRLAIPMRSGVSSLNLASAVAVVLYAWRLDRGGGSPILLRE